MSYKTLIRYTVVSHYASSSIYILQKKITKICCKQKHSQASKIKTVIIVQLRGDISDNDHQHGQSRWDGYLQESSHAGNKEEVGDVQQTAGHSRQLVVWGKN